MKAHLILAAVVALVLLGIPVSAPTWMVASAVRPWTSRREGPPSLRSTLFLAILSMPKRAAGRHRALPQSCAGSRFFGRTLPPGSRR